MAATHYMSSKGAMLISDMPYPHLTNAIAKMEREGKTEDSIFTALTDRKAVMEAEFSEKETEAPEAEANPGHNNPPETGTFESVKAELEDLRTEARNWLDGAEIESQQQADVVGRLLGMVRDAATKAEKQREAEKKPFADAANEVQARYNTLTGKTQKVTGVAVILDNALSLATQGWLRKQKAIQDAEAERLRIEADAATQKAREAFKSSQASTDLDEREGALAEIDRAREAAFALKQVEAAKPQIQVGNRNAGLKTQQVPEIEDLRAALRHYFADRPEEFRELVLKFAKDDLRSKKPSAPGIKIVEDLVF